MSLKRCAECRVHKPTIDFHLKPDAKDGLYPSCKACRKEINAEWYANNRARQNAATQAWRKTHPERHAVNHARSNIRHWAKYPEKTAARFAVRKAKMVGLLSQEPCFVCGDKAEAHHASYAPEMRLAVTWLCKTHHKQVHMETTP